jgi:hypothetical protein
MRRLSIYGSKSLQDKNYVPLRRAIDSGNSGVVDRGSPRSSLPGLQSALWNSEARRRLEDWENGNTIRLEVTRSAARKRDTSSYIDAVVEEERTYVLLPLSQTPGDTDGSAGYLVFTATG